MAIAISVPVAAVRDSGNISNYTMSSFNPAANAVLVVFVVATSEASAGAMAGGSLTWTRQDSNVYNTTDKIYAFTALTGATPAACAPEIQFTGDAATGCAMYCYQVTGADTTNPVVQKKAVQAATTSMATITLDVTPLVGSGFMAAVGVDANNPANVTIPLGFVSSVDTGYGTPATGLASAYTINRSTPSAFSWLAGAGTPSWGLAAVEIAVDPSTASVAVTSTRLRQSIRRRRS